MIELLRNIKKDVFIQIGTTDGTDDFNTLVKEIRPSLVVLVEPNKGTLLRIQENYIGVENIFIENVAITATKQDTAALYIPILNESGMAENGFQYGEQCWSLLPLDGWGETMQEMKVDSMTFDELCKKYNITHINYLQIDTEGYDSEIIQSIDFNKITIDILQYEKWYFPETAYTRYGKKAENYGIHGMVKVEQLLLANNYKLIADHVNIMAIKEDLL